MMSFTTVRSSIGEQAYPESMKFAPESLKDSTGWIIAHRRMRPKHARYKDVRGAIPGFVPTDLFMLDSGVH